MRLGTLVYTPVLIELVPAVVTVDDQPFAPPQPRTLKIINPTSRLPGAFQTLEQANFVKIPEQGAVRLRLIPSALYYPKGEYQVELYTGTNSIPVSKMKWIVPEPPCSIELEVVEPFAHFVVPVFQILKVNRQGTWRLYGNQIEWLDNPPAEGESYSVVIQPAVTLDQLIK